MKVQKNCEACFAPISVRLADHKRGWGRFCDKACAAAHKVGFRPRDVMQAGKRSGQWAISRKAALDQAGLQSWPAAPRIKDQVGKVSVKRLYHSPAKCRGCGVALNGPGLCDTCDGHEVGMYDNEAGWDGHKGAM